jgi:hypothetical protein
VACGLVVAATASLAPASVVAQATPERRAAPHVWLDSAGAPLPFQAPDEIVEYLRTAEVVGRKPIGQGTTGAERLLMDRHGVQARAAFRTVDDTHRGPFQNLPSSVRRVRDSAVFECAAYELSEALGLGRVPPTVCRRIGKAAGSVQIWFEGAMTQAEFLEKAPEPPDVARWNLQKQRMYVFDALVANLDRNQGNILVDRDGTLWLIDHTRAFVPTGDLLEPEKITRCSRELWLALRDLDEASVRKRLEPFLTDSEIRALFKRRTALVARIERLIAAEGEAAVLFEIDPPPARPTVWPLDNLERIGGHAVTRLGAPRLVTSPLGGAVEFDGAADGLLLDVNPIEGLTRFTVEVLLAPSPEGPEEQRFIHISETGSDRRVMLETRMLPDRSWCLDTYLRKDAPGLALIDRAKKHSAGRWHVAAVSYDGRTMASYVDGVRELSGDVPFQPLGAGRISIGVRQNRVSWFKGRIRLIRISPEALSPERLLTPPEP